MSIISRGLGPATAIAVVSMMATPAHAGNVTSAPNKQAIISASEPTPPSDPDPAEPGPGEVENPAPGTPPENPEENVPIPEQLMGEPSQFIEADSEEDALKKLDEIEANKIQGREPISGPVFGPCKLYPSRMHLRRSGQWNTIGPKPYTKCTAPGLTVAHKTKMYYKWYAWWRNMGTWNEAKVVKKVDGKNEWVYEQQSAAYQCKGKTKTTFSSSTLAGIVWGGKKLYARVYSKVVEKECTV